MMKYLSTINFYRLGLGVVATLLCLSFNHRSQDSTRISPEFSFSFGDVAWAKNDTSIEEEIIIELNKLRENPQSYIPILEKYLASMNAEGHIPNGCGRNCTLLTTEGKPAVKEAIQFLQQQQPINPVKYSAEAALAAQEHAKDQAGGSMGHIGSDGSTLKQRLNQHIDGLSIWAENISYGSRSASEVIRNWIIDDGVRGRGHRVNMFNPSLNAAGTGCGSHAKYRTVCVINYIGLSQNKSEI